MTLIYITIFISIAAIIGVLVWFAHQDPMIACCSNGCNCACEGDLPEDNSNWPFPRSKP